jgi:hypothetical protein
MSGRAEVHTPVDVRVAELATRQEGMISTEQLRALGIGRSGVHERVRRGRLHPYWRGVYLVGHTRLTHARGSGLRSWRAAGPMPHCSAIKLLPRRGT